ncbi:MAG TPA: YjbH domain-containing protein [Clostridiales bacterium]|nr:YjbH domain-containing protein [Clostridiales bacterium]
MKKIFAVILVISAVSVLAQPVNTKRMVDIPTAFTLKQAEIELSGRLYATDGMSTEINIGIFRDFFLGVSYGGSRIIGSEKPVWNGHPGVRLQYRLLPEEYYYPNIALGFDSQGYGVWIDPRYQVKSKGFFLVFSKNYFVSEGDLGTLGLHAGANYCVTEEAVPGDDNINAFLGFDKSLLKNMTLLCEYDFAFNDNSDNSLVSRGKGYLNIGLRWSFGNQLHLEFDIKDILKNFKGADNVSRELRVIYNTAFFTQN